MLDTVSKFKIPSLFEDNIASWVRIVNGVDKYVTESMLTTKEEDVASEKPIAKARPRQKPTVTLTSVSIIVLIRKWNGSTLKHNDHTITSVMKCQKPSPDCEDMINQSLEEAMEQSTTVTSSKSAGRRSSTMLRNGYLKIGYQLWQEGGGPKIRFQYCVNPNSSNQFLYLRAIQGHPGDNAVDPALQDNILLPERFTEYIYHVGNASELNSIRRNGLIPGQAVFFTTVKPMDDEYGMGETPCDLTKPRIAPCKNTCKRIQNTVCWCHFKLAQEKRLAILPNAVTCSRSLQHTTYSMH